MGCAEAVVKLLVFSANLVFALAGLGLIVLGVLYKLDFNDYTSAIPDDYQNISLAPTLTITIGAIIFAIAFFGCCGAIRESPCLLTTYAVILLVIFLAQVALGVFAFLEIKDKEGFGHKVEGTLKTLFNSYNSTTDRKELVDLMQQEFKCCGVKGPSDWPSVPDSCKHDNKIYEDGCYDKFFHFLYNSIQIIGITVLVMSVIEVVGCIFSLCLSSSIKNRERRFRY